MRILNIISNELVIKKQKLENELERLLNDTTTSTEEVVTKTIEALSKLTHTTNTMLTWESYINKEEKEQN
jgi:hypothetical protein|tara:strand:- start:326 stop:535 length:210 start_codon:yes stop_codon:yes gene_type:complete